MITRLVLTLLLMLSAASSEMSDCGYLVIITKFYPYHVTPYRILETRQIDSLLVENFGPAFRHFKTDSLLLQSNHFYAQTDSLKVEIDRKQIKGFRDGRVVLRRRKFEK